ncbi:late embryogenesis abundant protein At1g64065-like [Lotus japonicus]|uniref:late embryogenesis abundant protein At1g64065-like n=1 Tax=Lotus japonicus TaxID=34305 RepID=UPI00258ADCDE|nr:late embryogenesis abundant protein At1g64065-like [Lotus japonicus]
MADTDQERPLAPARVHVDEEALKTKRKRKIKWCGCVTVPILVLVIVIVILAFTVFKVKEPKVTTKGITITDFDLILNQGTTPTVKLNMTMMIDMSIKNPNVGSFKLGNTTTTIYYRGAVVAEARTPPGMVKARKTSGMNVTVDILADRLASSPNLMTDVIGGKMTMDTYSIIPGRVKIVFVKKHVEVRMNCTVTVNISSRAIQDMICKRKVKL